MSDKKLDLIAQLLAKAESTTPEEAEALTEHAERLMIKYGIEQARIDERRAKLGQASEKIIEARRLFTGTYARDLRDIGIAVAFGLGTLRPLQANLPGVGVILFLVGFESDVRQAETLISSLEVQGMVALRAWWRNNRVYYDGLSESDKRRARGGFLRGFGSGARRRIEANRQTIIEEAGTGTDLVLASRKARVDAVLDARNIRSARAREEADQWAYVDGIRAGEEANTGERAMTSGKALAR